MATAQRPGRLRRLVRPAPAQARRALDLIAGDLVPMQAAAIQAGRAQLFTLNGDSREAPGDTPPRLLGHFDPYLLGYRDAA